MPYAKNGTELDAAYSAAGVSLASVFGLDGTEYPFVSVTPKTWNLTDAYKEQILSALEYIDTYQKAHPHSYSICQFNDVHQVLSGNEPNFLDYSKGYRIYSRMLFLGDIVNTSNASEYALAVDYMSGASAANKLIIMGNHEYKNYDAAQGDPEALYKPLINVPVTYMFPNDDILIYYADDAENDCRVIALDYFYITKRNDDNTGHLIDMAQLHWCASAMENAGGKDIIIAAHSMMNPFYVLASGQQTSSSATLLNQSELVDLIAAFKSRGTYTVTVDGTAYQHDFSNCTGDFLFYTSGHYHIAGHTPDFGFNMFTGPALKGTSGGKQKGFVFFLIDTTLKTIQLIQCASDFEEYITYDFTY